MSLSRFFLMLGLLAVPVAAQQTTVLFESDGSSTADFPCDYGQVRPANVAVNYTDGVAPPSLEFQSPNLTMSRAGVYQFPGLLIGQKFHGSMNIKIEPQPGYVALAGFGVNTDISCSFPSVGNGIPYFGWRRSQPTGLSTFTKAQNGTIFGRLEPISEIPAGIWHTVDFELEPISNGVHQYALRLNGTVIHSGVHYEDLSGPRELGVQIGIDGSGEPTHVKYDNVKVEIIEPTPVSCVGFESPMANGPVKVRGKNRALPLKAELLDDGGAALTDAHLASTPVLQVLYDAGQGAGAVDVTDEALPAGQQTEGNQFIFTTDGKWQYNLSTKNYTAPGTYHLSIVTGDVEEYEISPSCQASFVVD